MTLNVNCLLNFTAVLSAHWVPLWVKRALPGLLRVIIYNVIQNEVYIRFCFFNSSFCPANSGSATICPIGIFLHSNWYPSNVLLIINCKHNCMWPIFPRFFCVSVFPPPQVRFVHLLWARHHRVVQVILVTRQDRVWLTAPEFVMQVFTLINSKCELLHYIALFCNSAVFQFYHDLPHIDVY